MSTNEISSESIKLLWDVDANEKDFEISSDNTKAHWIHKAYCGCIHRWFASYERVSNRLARSCHFCNQKSPCCVSSSLAKNLRFIEIEDQWDITNPQKPEEYLPQSNKTVKWKHVAKCGCLHEWSTSIEKRIGKCHNCPVCNGSRKDHPCIHRGCMCLGNQPPKKKRTRIETTK